MPLMRKSSRDKVTFSFALVAKFAETEAKFHQRGMIFSPPKSIVDAITRAKPMYARFALSDYRHTDEEAQAEHDVSIWLVNQHRSLFGQPPMSKPDWGDFTGDGDR